jgi:putative peptidoglycan lipid II flippase
MIGAHGCLPTRDGLPTDGSTVTDSLQNVSRNLRVVSLCTIVSRVFGLLRDQAMGSLFGAGPLLDSFTVAFRLPNLARVLLGEGALTTAFLPIIVEDLNQRSREAAVRTTWAVFIALAAVLCGLVVIAEAVLAGLLAWGGLSPESRMLCRLTSILLPYVILICLAAQLGAVLNALGRFVWPALVPVVLNVVWLVALWWLIPVWWTDPERQIQATAVCVVIAGGLQLSFLIPVVWRSGFGYRPDWRAAWPVVRRVASEMLPVVIGLSITQMNAVLDSFVAWGFAQPDGASPLMPLPGSPQYPLHAGTATAIYLGQRLYQFPLGVFGVALGTVLYPLFTQHAQRGEIERLRDDLSLGIRLVLVIGLPASAGLMLIAHPLATMFFQYGKFDAAAASLTADMIVCYGSGVWAYCGLLILQRGFYAVGDRLTPMYIGLGAMVLNVILNLTLIWPLAGRGLALSTALVSALQCIATCLLLQKRVGSLRWQSIAWTALRTLVAVTLMSAVCWLLSDPAPGDGGMKSRAIRLLIPLALGALTYFAAAWVLRLEELWMILFSRKRQPPAESL